MTEDQAQALALELEALARSMVFRAGEIRRALRPSAKLDEWLATAEQVDRSHYRTPLVERKPKDWLP